MFSTFLVTGKLSASFGHGIMAVIASQNKLETKTDREKCDTQIIASQNQTSAIKS